MRAFLVLFLYASLGLTNTFAADVTPRDRESDFRESFLQARNLLETSAQKEWHELLAAAESDIILLEPLSEELHINARPIRRLWIAPRRPIGLMFIRGSDEMLGGYWAENIRSRTPYALKLVGRLRYAAIRTEGFTSVGKGLLLLHVTNLVMTWNKEGVSPNVGIPIIAETWDIDGFEKIHRLLDSLVGPQWDAYRLLVKTTREKLRGGGTSEGFFTKILLWPPHEMHRVIAEALGETLSINENRFRAVLFRAQLVFDEVRQENPGLDEKALIQKKHAAMLHFLRVQQRLSVPGPAI